MDSATLLSTRFGTNTSRQRAFGSKPKHWFAVLGMALFALACSKGERAFGVGGNPVPDAVLATAIRMHTIVEDSSPIEGLATVQVTRSSAVRAQERAAKGKTDEDARAAARFATRLDVSAADAANGVEERVGIALRGIRRAKDGTARDVREDWVATRFQDGAWAVGGFLLNEAGAFAGRGDHAGHYRAEDTRRASGSFVCEVDLAPAGESVFRGTYRCAGRHRDYTYEPYRDVRYESVIEQFVEMAWTRARLAECRSGPGPRCVEAFLLTRSAEGEQALVKLEVQEDGDLVIPWHPPSQKEQGPSRSRSLRLIFQKQAATSGGGS